MMAAGATIGDRMSELLRDGEAPCRIVFSTGSIETGVVRYYGDFHGRRLWSLRTPTSEHFFGLDEVREMVPLLKSGK